MVVPLLEAVARLQFNDSPMPVHFISFEAACPQCGGRHRVQFQTELIGESQPGTFFFGVGSGVGDEFDPVASGYVVVRPQLRGEPLRVMEQGIPCGDTLLWTEISIVDARLAEMCLVRLDLAELDRLHFLPTPNGAFWGWVAGLLSPDAWEDELFTEDRARRLRLQLMLREPLAARNAHEAALFVEMIGCRSTSALTRSERDGRVVWQQACEVARRKNRALVLEFDLADARVAADGTVADLPAGPSSIITADFFRRRADELAAQVPAYPADLAGEATQALLDAARRDLGQAIVYLAQVLAQVPAGAEVVPASAFWGDDPRAAAAARPDRYARGRLEALLACWRDELAQLGVRPVPTVRSAEEAHVYMLVHPCPRCGRATPQLASRVVARGPDLVSAYEGACAGCGLARRFELRLDEALPEGGDAVSLGTDRSHCLDPGQLLAASDELVRGVPGDRAKRDARSTYALQLAVAVLDQVLAFIPAGATAVPEPAFASRAGWATYEAEPGRFELARLQAVRAAYRQLLGSPHLTLVD